MENTEFLQGNALYQKIQERLETCKDKDPTWQDIMASLVEKDDHDDYMSVIGTFTSYFGENGFARKIERVSTNGMPKTPRITMEQIETTHDADNKNMMNIVYTSYEDPYNPVVTSVEQTEKEYSVLEPGHKYVAISFEFGIKQRAEERQLFNALEFYYQELDRYFNTDNKENIEFPIMTITAVPLIYGGRYSVHMTNPFFWDYVNLEEEREGEIPKRALTVLFEMENVTFLADDEADPADTFIRCRSELASEWMREMQMRRMEQEREEYKQNREAEISEMLGRTKHTFRTTKYGQQNEPEETSDVE